MNPFLAEFYVPLLKGRNSDSSPQIPSENLGALYSSIRARLAIGEIASLNVDSDADEKGDDYAWATIETGRKETAEGRKLYTFEIIDPSGDISFGPQIEDVEISAPQATISIGFGSEARLVAPVCIDAGSLIVETSRMVAEAPRQTTKDDPVGLNAVQLFAEKAYVSDVTAQPVCRRKVLLEVCWPDAKSFPWTNFAVSRSEPDDTHIDNSDINEGVRRLKGFVRLFRSGGKGTLVKSSAAIDDSRRTKGVGGSVLEQLKKEGVITGSYTLHADRLAEVTGLRFQDVRSTEVQVHEKTINFVKKALQGD